MLLDASGNPITHSEPPAGSSPQEPSEAQTEGKAEEARPAEGSEPKIITPPPVDPLAPLIADMQGFQEAAGGEDTPEARDKVREKLGGALEKFRNLRGFKARLGPDYVIEISSTPKGKMRIDVNERTRRGKEFIEGWTRFIQDLQASGREAQLRGAIGQLFQMLGAAETVLNQLLVRVADLERKVNG